MLDCPRCEDCVPVVGTGGQERSSVPAREELLVSKGRGLSASPDTLGGTRRWRGGRRWGGGAGCSPAEEHPQEKSTMPW